MILGIASIIAAMKYTMGRKAYGYNGLGDLFVLLFFGLLGVVGSHYLYTKELDVLVFLPALAVGFLSVGVLNLNNLRDVASDTNANKRTLVVMMGPVLAKYYHYFLLFGAFLLTLLYSMVRYTNPIQFLFVLAFVPSGIHGVRV